MKRTSILISGLLIAGLSIFGYANLIAATPLAPTVLAAENAQQTRTFAIENMTCALCPVTVKKAMSNVNGVKSVNVNLDTKTATVEFDSTVTTVDEIAQSSTNAGYPATLSGDG